MDGFVAVTDPGWWEHLGREPGPRDANFWRPSPRAFRLVDGMPFLFKLKAPYAREELPIAERQLLILRGGIVDAMHGGIETVQ